MSLHVRDLFARLGVAENDETSRVISGRPRGGDGDETTALIETHNLFLKHGDSTRVRQFLRRGLRLILRLLLLFALLRRFHGFTLLLLHLHGVVVGLFFRLVRLVDVHAVVRLRLLSLLLRLCLCLGRRTKNSLNDFSASLVVILGDLSRVRERRRLAVRRHRAVRCGERTVDADEGGGHEDEREEVRKWIPVPVLREDEHPEHRGHSRTTRSRS